MASNRYGGNIGGNWPTIRICCPQMPLTDTAIKNAKPDTRPRRHFDGGGLYSRLPQQPEPAIVHLVDDDAALRQALTLLLGAHMVTSSTPTPMRNRSWQATSSTVPVASC